MPGYSIQDLSDLYRQEGGSASDAFDRSGEAATGTTPTPYNRYSALAGGGNVASTIPTGTQQSQALRQQTRNVSATTGTDPMQQDAYNRAANFESGLASGTSDETRRAVSQARDEVSVGMAKEGQAAGSRGADPSLFKSRALASGQRYVADVQGKALDSALNARQGAVNAVTSAAGDAATNKTNLQLGTLNAKLGQDRLSLDQSEAQARLEEAPYERLIQMMNTVASNRDAYSALGADGSATDPNSIIGGGGGSVGGAAGGGFGNTRVGRGVGGRMMG